MDSLFSYLILIKALYCSVHIIQGINDIDLSTYRIWCGKMENIYWKEVVKFLMKLSFSVGSVL